MSRLEKDFGSMQRCWSDREPIEKDFGSMQRYWSDRELIGKGFWVTIESLLLPRIINNRELGL